MGEAGEPNSAPASAMPPPPPRIPAIAGIDVARDTAASTANALEETMRRAASLAEGERQRRVNDEWSTVESLRHLVFVIDLWLSKAILGRADPFDPIGLPPSFMPPKFPGSSIDPDARPTFDEACQVLRGRLAAVGSHVEALTPEELDRAIEAHAGTVAGALGILFHELTAHTRFINRDLDIIEASQPT